MVFVTHSVDEAIYLADRIVIMSARPGRIKDIINIDLERPRSRTSPEVNALIFANMSSRMAENIKDELEITTNLRLKDVEEAQTRIVANIRRLEEEGQIVISKGGKDDIIV